MKYHRLQTCSCNKLKVFVKSFIAIFILTLVLWSCGQEKQEPMEKVISNAFTIALQHYENAVTQLTDSSRVPYTLYPDGKVKCSDTHFWTSGFFPGSLWFLYEYSGNEKWRKQAEKWTSVLDKEKYNTGSHDIGFTLNCSFGNGLRLTNNKTYKEVLITGANSLGTRFIKTVGCTKSLDETSIGIQCPVIIDNLMNLELLFWAFKETGDSTYYKMAVSHLDTTLKNHFREDYSSYHIVSYDTITGKVLKKMTGQGLADSSAWARGTSWSLYGYTMAYRFTKDKKHLEQAKNIAKFILNHPNLPTDYVPYWDFDAPGEERDASAGAVICSALIELSSFANKELKNKYLAAAEKILRSLSSPAYTAETGTNGNFVLMHSVGHKPGGWELDAPFNFADYYYFEALLRYKDILEKEQL